MIKQTKVGQKMQNQDEHENSKNVNKPKNQQFDNYLTQKINNNYDSGLGDKGLTLGLNQSVEHHTPG